ncbi:helix-turn-helix domain-containing protein [Halopiger goleimassiliensis]|uniref:helix-turn-helix domain-containing protein n=1 Tax=Halopiger goleimassiliensis TaxID=1293048 RepID=UPI0009DC1C29
MGYFEIPRATSLNEVSHKLDSFAPALSERLRRAQTRLVEAFISSEKRSRGLNH